MAHRATAAPIPWGRRPPAAAPTSRPALTGKRALRFSVLAAVLVACAPATLPAPTPPQPGQMASVARVQSAPLEGPPPDLPVAPAGADPVEDDAAPRLPATGAPELPGWLRPVRQPPPVLVVGSGQAWPKRVGLQVGHWASDQLPDELARLRESGGGASGGGYSEAQVNYELAHRTAGRLRERGVEVDVLPATVPMDYQADAFVAIHADGDARGVLRGYKIARSPLSHLPDWDDALVGWLYAEYARATALPRDDDHITRRMLFYYPFNNRRYDHAIHPSTPAAIVEAGFMTSAADRALLIGAPDRAAAGLAAGILGFLGVQ